MTKKVKLLVILGSILLVLVLIYLLLVFSNIKIIKKYREIYIETAMSTLSHQWLATTFIPESIIDDVMNRAGMQWEENIVTESRTSWSRDDIVIKEAPLGTSKVHKSDTKTGEALTDERRRELLGNSNSARRKEFIKIFDEIDYDTVPEDFNNWDFSNLHMKDIVDLGIKTTSGDSVWAIDAVNMILIVVVEGDNYKGKLAIIKNSSQVGIGVPHSQWRGETVGEICEYYDAVLGINANGFSDPEGVGDGSLAEGLIISNHEKFHDKTSVYYYMVCGFDDNDDFRIGSELTESELRDASQFFPALIVSGEKKVSGSYGLGIQPRTAIGQTSDKEVLMLVIDGRKFGHSIGATVDDCADILLRYDCWIAINMDGGSSSSMVYEGEIITKPSTPMANGRYLPDAWIVYKL